LVLLLRLFWRLLRVIVLSSSIRVGAVSVEEESTQVKLGPENTNPMRGILRRGFLNPSPMEKGDSLLSASLVVKDDEVEEASRSRSAIMDEAFRFGWDQEDNVWDGEFSPDPLDWVLDCIEDEDPTLAPMDEVKEDFVLEVKVAWSRTKGKRELLNLESSVMAWLACPLGEGGPRLLGCSFLYGL
jgi:hypothetical protein